MEFETVGAVSVSGLFGHVLGQVDDLDRFKGAFFNANAASDTQWFGNPTDGRSGLHFDTNLADLVSWAVSGALLLAFLRFALIGVDNGDSEL
jgi:hypothetical protein